MERLILLTLLLCIESAKAVHIELFEHNTFRSFRSCSAVSGVANSYTINGTINTSEFYAEMILFEKINIKHATSYLVCLERFSEICFRKTKSRCSCTSTESPKIYNIMLNATLTESDEYSVVRAGVINRNGEKQLSESIELQRLFQPVYMNNSIDLQINNYQVDINNCSALTNNDIITISYNSLNQSVSVKIQTPSSIEKVNESNNGIIIRKKAFEEPMISFTLQFYNCHQIVTNVTCTIITEYTAIEEGTSRNFYFLLFLFFFLFTIPVGLIVYLKCTKRRQKTEMTEIGRIGKCTSIMDTSLTATLPKINGFPYEGQELLSTEEKPTYRLLLIGKIGNGKSATGNTLLEKPAFQISSSLEYKRASIRKGFRELHNYNIEVVEAPGLDIMQFRDIDQMSYTFSLFYKAIALESEGFDAILLVLRFGNVFESQDIESIKFFKLILGQDFIKNHCIIVFTCGDLFKKEKDSFKKWLFQQKGEFKKLVDECERRVVLFDNETKLESEKSKQVSKLIKMVDLLKTNNYKYSLENYTLANDGRSRLFLKLFSNNYSNKLFKYSSCFNGENELYNMNLYPAKKRSSHNAEVSFMKRLKSYITEAVKHNFKNVSDLKYKDETPQKVVFVETASELDNTSQDYSFNDKKVTQQNNDNENLHCHVLLHEAPF